MGLVSSHLETQFGSNKIFFYYKAQKLGLMIYDSVDFLKTFYSNFLFQLDESTCGWTIFFSLFEDICFLLVYICVHFFLCQLMCFYFYNGIVSLRKEISLSPKCCYHVGNMMVGWFVFLELLYARLRCIIGKSVCPHWFYLTDSFKNMKMQTLKSTHHYYV